tara:strand:- start:51357 stop:51527 length:171 start_codon:yes stop_codon:yes gene_type:complete
VKNNSNTEFGLSEESEFNVFVRSNSGKDKYNIVDSIEEAQKVVEINAIPENHMIKL